MLIYNKEMILLKFVRRFLVIMTVLVYLIHSSISSVNNFDVDKFNSTFPAEPVFDLDEVIAKNAEVARLSLERANKLE